MVLLVVSAVLVIFIASFFLVETLLAAWFDPRHEQMENRRELLELYAHVDSLEQSVLAKQIYLSRIQNVLSGDTTQDFSDIQAGLATSISDSNTYVEEMDVAPIDSQFRKEFENMVISPRTNGGGDNTIPFLFTPLDGYISQSYDLKADHLGVDIVAKENEPVKNIADGTVIFSDWTREFGYVLAIQHSGNLISIYKHNSKLLKKVGNFVTEGEIISIIGNSGELTSGPHLHFELWHNGNSLDPEEFVVF